VPVFSQTVGADNRKGVEMTDKPICDFCASPYVKWTHYTKPFTVHVPEIKTDINMSADWAVCEACHQYIINKRWCDLWCRSLENLRRPSMLSLESHARFIIEVHDGFVRNQTDQPPVQES
jgi:hypothetical protein